MKLTRKDLFVAFVCVVFLLVTMGSIGSGGRRRAKEVVCVANLHRWGKVFHSFVQYNDGKFMDRSDAHGWAETLWSFYNGRTKLLLCPEATKSFQEGGRNPHMAWEYYIDSDLLNISAKGSYGINLWCVNERGDGKLGSQKQEYWRTPYIAGADEAPLFGDAQWTSADPIFTDDPLPYESNVWTRNTDEMQRFCVNRHNGVNLLFLDFSVRKVGLKHLWRQRWHRYWPDDDEPLPDWPEWMSNYTDPE